MQLEGYRTVFAAITLIGVLLFASPALGFFIESPKTEQFTALYILGPNHDMNNVPFKIYAGKNYSVYLGVSNQMGSAEYYTCVIKFGNDTADLPNTDLKLPSPLPDLYVYKNFIKNEETREDLLNFQFNNVTFYQNTSRLSSITINGLTYGINKEVSWNSNKTGYYNLIVELWMYNSTTGVSQFNNRTVHLLLTAAEDTNS